MNRKLRAAVGWILVASVALILLQALGLAFTSIEEFNETPLGRLLPAIIASGILIPHLRELLRTGPRTRRVDALVHEILAATRKTGSPATANFERHYLKLFGRGVVTDTMLDEMAPDEAAVFLLGLQFYYTKINLDEKIGLFNIMEVAQRSAKSISYREIMLVSSLASVLFSPEEAAVLGGRLLKRSAGMTHVQYQSEDEDQKFFERLGHVSDEELFIFSTTSQISHSSLELIREHSARIRQVNLFLVSPFLTTDSALGELKKEYDVPACARPPSQFLPDDDLDLVRRVLRILLALEALREFQEQAQVQIDVWLFRVKYPDLKLRILSRRGYMQLLPGSLKYANNIYRFGIEITEQDSIEPVLEKVREMMRDPQQVTHLALDPVRLHQVRDRALREAARHLIQQGTPPTELETLRPKFRFVLRNPRTDGYLDAIRALMAAADQAIDRYQYSAAMVNQRVDKIYRSDEPTSPGSLVVQLASGVRKHVSVGIFFVRSNHEVLMITKRAVPYAGAFSLVAGHLEEGETPTRALVREVKEEIGVSLDLTRCELIRHYDDIPGDLCRYGALHHEWYIFITDQAINEGDLKLAGDEIGEARWVSFAKMRDLPSLTFATREILNDLGVS